MGLLDSLDDPRQVGLLSLGLGLLNSRGSFGQGLGQAGQQSLLAMQEAKQRQQMSAARQQQMQMQGLQMQQLAAMAQEQARRQAVEAAYRAAVRDPAQAAMAQHGGPTVAAANAANVMPAIDHPALVRGLMKADPMAAYQMLQPKPADYKVVGDALVQVGPDGVKEAYKSQKPTDYNQLIVTGPDGKPTLNTMLMDAKRQIAQAGAANTNVSVNTGQKGFDNTLKLRGDFRSEPVYKAHQEMQSAYAQIQQSLKQASPAGDLAGATKIMKLLDPGSVVRESELGMAMQASGLMDRVENYAKNILAGTKLTPTQRADFQRLADALYGESVKQYNSKRSEYQGIAERNGLSVPDVLGSESAAPNGGWGIKRKGE